MKELISIFLPVIWVLVATIVGLALYKTSEALFETATVNDTKTKRIRLTGSVLIATVAFYGMRSSTSANALSVHDVGIIQVKEADVKVAQAQANQLRTALVDLSACLAIDQKGSGCRSQITTSQKLAKDVTDRIDMLYSQASLLQ